MRISPDQRHKRDHPCMICGGFDTQPRRQGVRCHGYLSSDGQYAHCSRKNMAGGLPLQQPSSTYAHKISGSCGCGNIHEHDSNSPVAATMKAGSSPTSTYPYFDADGNLSFEVIRNFPKKFLQRRPDGQGGWEYKLDGVRPILYRLPELLRSGPSEPVFIPEGEKDVATCRAEGLVATCNPGGAGKWRDQYSNVLEGRIVVILPDNDDPGKRHARSVAESVYKTAASVQILKLPGLPDLPAGGDITDWFQAGHTVDELTDLVQSAALWKPDSAMPLTITIRMSDVAPQSVEWIWDPYLPRGKVTILEGDPEAGKSWVSLAIASAISTGTLLPGQERLPRGSVLVASAEDGLADTVRPRLNLLGADVDRVHAIKRQLVLDKDGLKTLEEAIVETGPVLVVIDPLVAYMGGKVDMHRANETRELMGGLAELAEYHGCAILAIRHLTKGTANRAIYRGIGSIDFTAAARSVLLAGANPEYPDERGIVHIKSNLAPHGPSIGYTLGKDGTFTWSEGCSLTAAMILAQEPNAHSQTALQEAQQFLRNTLKDGPIEATRILADATAEGISEKTLRRAKDSLGLQSIRRGEKGKRGNAYYVWLFPETTNDLGGQTSQSRDSGQLKDPRHTDSPTTYELGHLNPEDDIKADGCGYYDIG
ncbi:hypothetical protein FIM12_04585 [SAR202 cluster bacterium AD-804-J14_MRT_500m]|nr:hypothetical protein [SAR202 cluster bacterium AD-804-J14_MRT_500m]